MAGKDDTSRNKGLSPEDFRRALAPERTIFKNREILAPAFIPNRIFHREEQVGQIGKTLSVTLQRAVPPNLILEGPAGSGKCVVGDTTIVQPDGGLCQIEEIVKEKRGGVLSLNEDLKVVSDKPAAYLDMGFSRVLSVKTRSGRAIKTTPEHPFLTARGWKACAELRVGERIATPRRIDFFGGLGLQDHKIKILAYLLAEGCVSFESSSVRFTSSDPEILQDFVECAEKFRNVRAVVRAYKNRTPYVHASNEGYPKMVDARELRKRFRVGPISHGAGWRGCSRSIVQMYSEGFSARTIAMVYGVSEGTIRFGLRKLGVRLRKRGGWSTNFLLRWLESIDYRGTTAKEKEIPPIVFKLNRRSLALFLNRLFAGDGWASLCRRGRVQIGYSTSSERMARQVQHLLLRFGVNMGLREKKTHRAKSFVLEVENTEGVLRFLEKIGSFSPKCGKLKVFCANQKMNPNLDVFPMQVWDFVRARKKTSAGRTWSGVGRVLGWKRPKRFSGTPRGRSPTRRTLGTIADVWGDPWIKKLAESDIFWDQVVEIEPAGVERVYDLTVNPTHNFVANDIFVHNTAVFRRTQEVLVEERRRLGIDFLAGYAVADGTSYQNLVDLAASVGCRIPSPGLSFKKAWRVFDDWLGGRILVAALDEVDKALLREPSSDLLYHMLSRERTSVAVISNKENFLGMVEDPRITSRLHGRFVLFPRYTAPELQDILRDRVRESLVPGAAGGKVVNLCAALAASKFNADARYALELLAFSADLAMESGCEVIEEQHVHEASERLLVERAYAPVHRLSKSEAIFLLAAAEREGLSPSEIHTRADEISLALGGDPYSVRMRSEVFARLDTKGLVRSERRGLGRGRGAQFSVRLGDRLSTERVRSIAREILGLG